MDIACIGWKQTEDVLNKQKQKQKCVTAKIWNVTCQMWLGTAARSRAQKKGRFEVGEPIQASERMQSLHLNFAPLLPAGDFSLSDSLVLNFYYKLVFYVSKAVCHTFSLSIRN